VNALLEHMPLVIIVFLTFCLLTAFSNMRAVRRFDEYSPPARLPPVSILVPARNEGRTIETCVRSLLSQDYPSFEVLVLDDDSTDETRSILARLARQDSRLRILDGKLLPSDWLGKHWACHQLAQAARGELLLFTDADTRHQPQALRDSVAALMAERADLVTALPAQDVVSWGEKLIIPVIGWGIFSFLPIRLAHRNASPSLSVTIGQFMLFRRMAYDAVGGYAGVRLQVVDDVALGRRILAQGLRWRLLDGSAHVRCRMYRGFREAVDGFTKNVFAFFDYRLVPFLIALGWVGFVFLRPPLVLIDYALGVSVTRFPPNLALVAVAQSLLLWRTTYRRAGFPGYLAIFYPISLFLFLLIALRSLLYTVTGRASWKGRCLIKPAMRWM
jgi:chlorobactene glucosyltransferase